MDAIKIISDPFEIRKLTLQIVNAEIIDFNPETVIYIFRNRGHVIARRAGDDLEALYFYLNLLGEHEIMTKEQEQLLKVMKKRLVLSGTKKWLFI